MSVFSEYLTNCVNHHIEATRSSKNELIGACCVNRSTFFQCLRGDRLPTRKLLHTLLTLLEIPEAERQELKRLFYVEQIGWDRYQNHRSVVSGLEAFAAFSQMPAARLAPAIGAPERWGSETTLYGKEDVVRAECELIRRELSREEPCIDLFLPPNNRPFFDELKKMYWQRGRKKVRLRQLVQLPREKEEKEQESMALLRFISFFLLSGGDGYEAYYYYADTNYSETLGVLYPYSIVTGEGVLFINEALDACLLSKLPHVQRVCREQFQDNLRRARPFFTTDLGYRQMAKLLCDWEGEKLQAFQFSPLPAFGVYLPGGPMGKLIKRYSAREIHGLLLQFYRNLSQKTEYISFCTKRGLLSFARTGRVPGVAEKDELVLEPKERKEMLEALWRRGVQKGKVCLIDERKLPITDQFSVSAFDGQCVQLRSRGGGRQREYQFLEQNLVECFTGFFQDMTSEPFRSERVQLEQMKQVEQVIQQAIALCGAE